MKCITGIHEWTNPDDAHKCCNGYRRVLVIGNTTGCSIRGSESLPNRVQYGYKWAEK